MTPLGILILQSIVAFSMIHITLSVEVITESKADAIRRINHE